MDENASELKIERNKNAEYAKRWREKIKADPLQYEEYKRNETDRKRLSKNKKMRPSSVQTRKVHRKMLS